MSDPPSEIRRRGSKRGPALGSPSPLDRGRRSAGRQRRSKHRRASDLERATKPRTLRSGRTPSNWSMRSLKSRSPTSAFGSLPIPRTIRLSSSSRTSSGSWCYRTEQNSKRSATRSMSSNITAHRGNGARAERTSCRHLSPARFRSLSARRSTSLAGSATRSPPIDLVRCRFAIATKPKRASPSRQPGAVAEVPGFGFRRRRRDWASEALTCSSGEIHPDSGWEPPRCTARSGSSPSRFGSISTPVADSRSTWISMVAACRLPI